MKNNYINSALMALAVVSSAAGCQSDPDSHSFENKVFISASSFNQQILVKTDEGVKEMSSDFVISMAEPEQEDVSVQLRYAPELLDRYKLAYYDENAVLLPDNHCIPPDFSSVISAGNLSSSPVEFMFTGLDVLDYSTSYVYPVTIESTSGISVLESARTIYFVVKEASLINVVADISDNCAWPDWENFDKVADMETFTMEALVNATAFQNESSVHTIMGIEDVFLIRVGDISIPKNQLQISTARIDVENNTTFRASVSNNSMQLKPDRWYHIAVTFDKGIVNVYIDGKLKGEGDFASDAVKVTSINFKVKHSDESDNQPRCFWIGYSYDKNRPFNGMISEVRVWDRVLSADEINAPSHFYKIRTDDAEQMEGLVAYWKFNEGTGNVIKDYSGYENDLKTQTSVVWKNVTLPEKQ